MTNKEIILMIASFDNAMLMVGKKITFIHINGKKRKIEKERAK